MYNLVLSYNFIGFALRKNIISLSVFRTYFYSGDRKEFKKFRNYCIVNLRQHIKYLENLDLIYLLAH